MSYLNGNSASRLHILVFGQGNGIRLTILNNRNILFTIMDHHGGTLWEDEVRGGLPVGDRGHLTGVLHKIWRTISKIVKTIK